MSSTVTLTLASPLLLVGGPGEMVSRGSKSDSDDVPGNRSDAAQHARNTSRPGGARYRMTSEIAARGRDFLILNDAGENVFLISGRSISEDDTIRIESMGGQVLYEASAHSPRKQRQIVIVDGTGVQRGSVERITVSPLRDRFTIELEDGILLAVEGNVPKHEFSIDGPDGIVAKISQKWFRARGSYGVEISPDQRDALLLTSVVVLDQMIHGSS